MPVKRFQIKIVDKNMVELVHEITTRVVTRVIVAAGMQVSDMTLYPKVFEAVKECIKPYVHGFHVCGCKEHCDIESAFTELKDKQTPTQDFKIVQPKSNRIHRYVLALEIPLADFVHKLEVAIIKAVAKNTTVKNWHKSLVGIIKNAVEPTLGNYLYYNPT